MSVIRKGRVPHAPQGVSEYNTEHYTISGFLGDWAYIYRKHNLAHPTKWSSDDLMYSGIDPNKLLTRNGRANLGYPLPLVKGEGVSVSLSRQTRPLPFLTRNLDGNEIRFYHKGHSILETELGPLETRPGDFVVVPKGICYREVPKSKDNFVVIFEVNDPMRLGEQLADRMGFAGGFIDYSTMEIPTPDEIEQGSDEETEVMVKYNDKYESMTYEFNPCKDVIGWIGDPVLFKMNVWDIPCIATSFGVLPPITNAVLYSENNSFFFNVIGPRPYTNTPAPKGSTGAPTHRNDYDEVWFNHRSDLSPQTDGHMWLLPRTLPHPGLKKSPEYPTGPVKQEHEMQLNFDTTAQLRFTPEAKEAMFKDPQVSVYTSFYGIHANLVPEAALKHVKK